MAKTSKREWVWLQCTESGDLNYSTQVNLQGGIPVRLRDGIKKYSKRLRRRTVHKVKRR